MKSSIHILVVSASLALGCGSSRQSAWDTTPQHTQVTAAQRQQATTAAQTGDAAWAERGTEARLRAAIAAWEQVVAANPSDHETLTKLSHAYYFLADGYLSFDEAHQPEMMSTFEKGTQAAEHALMALSSDFAQRMQAGTRIEEAVSILDRSAVPALYWRSANLGKWASAQGFATLLSYKDEIRAVMTRCLELDANYFYAAPHRYFGAFYARAPSFAGGDLVRSKEHFEQSLRFAPNYFATRVLYAQDYAVKAQERATFDAQLAYVLAHQPSELPDAEPENTVEQHKARDLQARAGDLFE